MSSSQATTLTSIRNLKKKTQAGHADQSPCLWLRYGMVCCQISPDVLLLYIFKEVQISNDSPGHNSGFTHVSGVGSRHAPLTFILSLSLSRLLISIPELCASADTACQSNTSAFKKSHSSIHPVKL